MFQSGRDIDAITVKIAVIIDQDIPEIDPDTVLDASVVMDICFALSHFALDVDGELDRIDDAVKLSQQAIACRLDDPAGIQTERRVYEAGSVRFLARWPQLAWQLPARSPI